MSELVPALKDTLFSPTYEIVAEYAEIGIDALLDNEVLKGIPVVSTLSSICKIGYNLHERNLIKQTLAFITEFNSGSISQGKLNEHREKLEANPKEAEKELGRVLIILGNQVEQIQSQVLNEARFSNIFIEKRASSCPQSLEKSRLFSYPLLMSEGENSQNVKRIFLRKVVI